MISHTHRHTHTHTHTHTCILATGVISLFVFSFFIGDYVFIVRVLFTILIARFFISLSSLMVGGRD